MLDAACRGFGMLFKMSHNDDARCISSPFCILPDAVITSRCRTQTLNKDDSFKISDSQPSSLLICLDMFVRL
jgi:hypothetical protein